jgi:hypothetical protein
LLYGLDNLPNLTVIVATTSLNKRFDLEKIARYVERIPPLSNEYLVPLVQTFRDELLSFNDFFDIAPPEQRAKMRISDPRFKEMYLRFFDRTSTDIALAFLSLCKTPRSLKNGFRRCYEFWSQHTGP